MVSNRLTDEVQLKVSLFMKYLADIYDVRKPAVNVNVRLKWHDVKHCDVYRIHTREVMEVNP